MSSTTTHPPTGPSPPYPYPSRPVPNLEQLYQMTSIPEERVVIRDVDWAFYEQLVDSIPPGANIYADYDGKDVELMSLSGFHDVLKKRMGRFAELVAEELEIRVIVAHKVKDRYIACLTMPIQAAVPLLEASRIPRHVIVQQKARALLEVHSFRCRVRSNEYA